LKKTNHTPSLATKLAQALRFIDEETGSVIPVIQTTSTYVRDENYNIRKPYWYRRDGNQTTAHAEKIIAELEGAQESLLFASGMSAAMGVIEHLPAGAHVVVPKAMYHGVLHQFQNYAKKGRLSVDYYEAGNLEEMAAAVKKGETAIVWAETPNNPDWEVTDIEAAAKIAHAARANRLHRHTALLDPCLGFRG